jgi:hypothetical protein
VYLVINFDATIGGLAFISILGVFEMGVVGAGYAVYSIMRS